MEGGTATRKQFAQEFYPSCECFPAVGCDPCDPIYAGMFERFGLPCSCDYICDRFENANVTCECSGPPTNPLTDKCPQ